MGHIGILSRNGVRLHLVTQLIFIPAAVNPYLLSGSVCIAKTVQIHKHPVLVRRYVISLVIHEVQHDVPILVNSIEVIPVTNNYLQFSSLQCYEAFQLLSIPEPDWMEVDEEVDDCRQEGEWPLFRMQPPSRECISAGWG